MNLKRSLGAARLGMTVTALAALGALPAFGADSLVPKKDGVPEFLPVDQAFELQPLEKKGGKLEVSWRIAKGYFLYQERIKFAAVTPASLKLGAPGFPAGEVHEDEYFGKTHVFHNDTLKVSLPLDKDARGPLSITVSYQGCADAGLCYPPQTRTLDVSRGE